MVCDHFEQLINIMPSFSWNFNVKSIKLSRFFFALFSAYNSTLCKYITLQNFNIREWGFYLEVARSILFATITSITSFPLSERISSTHFVMLLKDDVPVKKTVQISTVLGSLCTCAIKNHNCSRAVSNITRDEAPKSLLASRVPKLQFNGTIIIIKCFRDEIYSHSWLGGKVSELFQVRGG